MSVTPRTVSGLELKAGTTEAHDRVLTPDALEFIGSLVRDFSSPRDELLARRRERQRRFDAGERPDFLPDTQKVRESEWTVAPIPRDLLDRRVEITGPVDRKMVINALNSGARVFMADFEDSNSPTWDNVVLGHQHLKDAVAGTIEYTAPDTGKHYRLGPRPAVLMVRPRGWHLPEKHVTLDGRPIPASLFDFGLYLFHNARALMARGSGPYFYLPKLQSHLEARLWNDVFLTAQERLGDPFRHDPGDGADRDAAGGLRDGRDPVRAARALGRAQLRALGLHLQRHQDAARRPGLGDAGPRAGDDAAAVHARLHAAADQDVPPPRGARDGRHGRADPGRRTPPRTRRPCERVRADKLREVQDGHDGTWVAHPGLVPIANAIFDEHMPGPNQIDRKREDVQRLCAGPAAGAAGHAHRGGAAPQRARRRAVPRGVAAGQRLRPALQPDGGRRHRRDLAHPGLAVAAPPLRARRRKRSQRGAIPEHPERGARKAQGRARSAEVRRRPLRGG